MSMGIYKFTNKLNNLSYIGQSIHLERRFNEHLQVALHRPKSIFHRALHKYGIQNFSYEVLEICLEEELDEKEIYYIQKYNTITPNGYNLQLGGVSGRTTPEDWVVQIQDMLQDTNNTQTLISIAEEYGVNRRTIYRINQGEVWYDENRTYPLRPKPEYHHGAWYCVDCGVQISKGSTRCTKCASKQQQTVERPIKEVLAQEIVEFGFSAVGRKYGVSGNTIKKWCVACGLPKLKPDIIQWVKENL